MGGKYSAEWWEKIKGLNREILARDDPSSVIGDLIPTTASAKPSPARKSETSRPGFNGPEATPSQAPHTK
jgi:hypothetical protein